MSLRGASYYLANIDQESAISPYAIGDSGLALGLDQMHLGRRGAGSGLEAMPTSASDLQTLINMQIVWSFSEAKRDGFSPNLREDLSNPKTSADVIRKRLSDWERYGDGEGDRTSHGAQIFSILSGSV